MAWGLPYKGSKNRLVKKITELFPEANNFYDLFVGGGAITHYLLTTNKFKNIYVNDVDKKTIQFLKNAFDGVYENRTDWVSRDEFNSLKGEDPFIASAWSFGNGGRNYMYSKENEIYKQAAHYAIVFNDWSKLNQLYPQETVNVLEQSIKNLTDTKERRLAFGTAAKKLKLINLDGAEALNRIERITNLSNVERVNNLSGVNNNIHFSNLDYRDVEIKNDSIIYADIPYEGTSGYSQPFNHGEFYEWAKQQTVPIFISSYQMPPEFKIVAEFEFRSLMGPNKKVTERIFTI